MFAGEVELLETRLHVLSAVVDVFVIVEADVAHSGAYNRTLAFPAARERFRPFLHRIRYLGLHAKQASHMRACAGSGELAASVPMRQCGASTLCVAACFVRFFAAGARPTDIIVSGDVDEIPRPEFLSPFRECEIFGPASNLRTHPAVVILLAEMWMFNIGCFTGQSRWSYGPKVGAVFQFDLLRDEPGVGVAA